MRRSGPGEPGPGGGRRTGNRGTASRGGGPSSRTERSAEIARAGDGMIAGAARAPVDEDRDEREGDLRPVRGAMLARGVARRRTHAARGSPAAPVFPATTKS